MKNLTPEMIEKAKAVKSAEELLALAKENGVEMTADESVNFFAQLNPKSGELDDDDLDNVAGGACQYVEDDPLIGKIVRVTSGQTCKKCGGNIGIVDTSRLGFGLVLAANCKDCTAGNKVYEIAILDQCTYEIIG